MKATNPPSVHASLFKRVAKFIKQSWNRRAYIIGLVVAALAMAAVIAVYVSTHSNKLHAVATKLSASHLTPKVIPTPQTQRASPSAPQATPSWWRPGTGVLPWQWILSHPLNTENAQDMGINSRTYQGSSAAKPVVYDIDGFNNTASVVASIHARGAHAICYVEVGALENYRPDASAFPIATRGNSIPDYPDERYLDITNETVVSLIKARIAMCRDKGFDAIEPDIDDSYGMNTGFSISLPNEVQYLTNLANYAHSLGMAWGLKNGADAGDPQSFIAAMLPSIDFTVIEEPFYLNTIGNFYPLLYNTNKAAFVAEYTNDTADAASFCTKATSDHVNAALFSVDLDASIRVGCQ